MIPFETLLHQEMTRFTIRFGAHLLGVIEIGAFALNEAVSFSDHDLRLIINSSEPMLKFNEHNWTDGICNATAIIDWSELNYSQKLTFGLTNIAFVECALRVNRFPLVDHTCLYQGKILIDKTGEIERFLSRYDGIRFQNIVPDYLRQVAWRITDKLSHDLLSLTKKLNHDKYAVPAVHTCYRISRDLANIASYDAHNVFIIDSNALAQYYEKQWPWFAATFHTLRSYKTDENQRRKVFNDLKNLDKKRINQIHRIADATISLWQEFSKLYIYKINLRMPDITI